jgi:hypothetical protein
MLRQIIYTTNNRNVMRKFLGLSLFILISSFSHFCLSLSCGRALDFSSTFDPKAKPDLKNTKNTSAKIAPIKLEKMNISGASPIAKCPEDIKLEISASDTSNINFDKIGIYIRVKESKNNDLKIADVAFFRTHISRDGKKAIYKISFRWTDLTDYTGKNFMVDLYAINKDGELIGIAKRKITSKEMKNSIKIQEPEYQVGEFSNPKLITSGDNFQRISTDLVDDDTRVLYTAFIDANGNVIKVIVSYSGSSINADKIQSDVINKVSRFKFKPALENGNAVSGHFNGIVTFTPN